MLLRSGALGMNCHPEGSLSDRRISTEGTRRSFTSCYSVQDDIETQAYVNDDFHSASCAPSLPG